MTRSTRAGVAVLLGFVAYRVAIEFMELGPALLIGAAIGGATWLLTGRIPARAAKDEEQ